MMTSSRAFRAFAILALALGLAACASTPKSKGGGTVSAARGGEKVTPRPHAKVGNPYFIKGIRYVPREDPDYDETGIASWYGPQFHGKLTANGELFDMDRLTAAHKTLPLPSLVRITNPANGRSAVVRLNDRGPFAGDRIIDLSRKTAEVLGTREQGLAEVRVEYLGPASLSHAITAIGLPEDMDALSPPVNRPRRHRVAYAPEAIDTGTSGGPVRAMPAVATDAGPAATPEIEAIEISAAPAVASSAVTSAATTRPGRDTISIVRAGETVGEIRDSRDMTGIAGTEPLAPASGYFVQIGVFSDPENASRASGAFGEAVPVSIEQVIVGPDTRHRLRLGPYAHEFAADAARQAAIDRGFGDAHIVHAGSVR